MRAKQHHPESQKLYLTFFRIELENKLKTIELDAIKHADVVYASSRKKFSNIEFYIEMLDIVDNFSYAHTIQSRILSDMRTMFARNELLWHTLAQRELKGLSVECNVDCKAELIKVECQSEEMNYSDSENRCSEDAENGNEDVKMDVDLENVKTEESAEPQPNTLKKRIEICIQIYEAAVEWVSLTWYY